MVLHILDKLWNHLVQGIPDVHHIARTYFYFFFFLSNIHLVLKALELDLFVLPA